MKPPSVRKAAGGPIGPSAGWNWRKIDTPLRATWNNARLAGVVAERPAFLPPAWPAYPAAMPLDAAPARPLIPPKPTPPKAPLGPIGLISAMRASMLSIWGPRSYELPILHGRLYGRHRILVNDPAAVRRVLHENAAAYEKPPPTRRLTRPIIGEGLFLAEGREWRRQRRALSPAFTPQHVEEVAPHFADAGRALIGALGEGGRLQLQIPLQEAALDAAARSMFSMPIGGRGERLAGLARRYISGPGRPNAFDMIATNEGDFAWLSPGRILFRRRWLKEVDQVVAARRAQARGEADQDDLLDLLIKVRDPETGEPLTDAEIRDQTATMLAAGFETTARALFWTLYLLALDPAEQAAVRADVAADPPSASIADATRRWPRMRQAVFESMRLYPPAPMLFRIATQRDRLLHVDVEPGSIVVIAPWIIHRHKLLWEEPDAFIPGRFAGKDREYLAGGAYLPFGAGPRICIGASFAMMELQIVLALLLERFSFALDDDRRLTPMSIITTMPDIDPWFRVSPAGS
jgi:cytochrome P450